MRHILRITLFLGLAAAALALSDEEVAKKYGGTVTPEEGQKLIAEVKWTTRTDPGIGSPEAKKGGKIRMGQQNYPATLRYFGKNGNSVTARFMHFFMTHETLLNLHPDSLEFVTGIAKEWSISEDKLTFHFRIDEAAKFSDGKPITAYDVVASWDLLFDDGLEDPFWKDAWGKFERPVALSKDVVRIRSKELGWRQFLTAATELLVFPAHVLGDITGARYVDEYNDKFLPGSGPYELEKAETNVSVSFKRRDDWWAKDRPLNVGLFNFDVIEFLFVENEDLLWQRFKNGDIDLYLVNISKRWVAEMDFDAVKKGHILKRKVYSHKPKALQGIGFNLRKPPFDDKRTRQAFAHLLHREEMMEKLFYNEYDFIDSFNPGGPYAHPDTPKVRYDPEKAVALLEEAGWKQENRNEEGVLTKDGQLLQLTLLYTSKSSERFLTVLQEDLAEVGIKLDIKEVTWAEDIKQTGERNFQITQRAYQLIVFPNPEQYHSKFADKQDNNNIWGLKSAEVDKLIDQEKLSFDIAERTKIVQAVDKIMCEEYLYAFEWYAPAERITFWNKFSQTPGVLSRYNDHHSALWLWWLDPEKDKALTEARTSGKDLPAGEMEVKWWLERSKPAGQ